MGESGTGKELVAGSIHKCGQRRNNRFVPVDCGAIPENLLENEFFGYEKGAFTGAQGAALGLIEFAKNGTFFLDEVCELPLHLQSKLLRGLQERKFRRVGGQQEMEADIRVIAATNRDIKKEVNEGRFRADLYYRLNVVQLILPPLRERKEDIPLLVDYFIKHLSRELNRPLPDVSSDALEILCAYPWTGNIRELQNVLKRALALCPENQINVGDLPEEMVATAGEFSQNGKQGLFYFKNQKVIEFEKEYLAKLLQKYDGDVSAAAQEALIPRGTFYRLMKKCGLDAKEFRK